MKKNNYLLSSILLANFILSPITIAAETGTNLIVNGSFEDDDFSDIITFPSEFTGINGTFIGATYNNNSMAGWDYTQNFDGWIEGGAWASAYDGKQYVDVMGNTNVTGGTLNELFQMIDTDVGKTYTFSFYWGEDIGHTAGEVVTLQASVVDANNNAIIDETITYNALGPVQGVNGPNKWFLFEETFVATTEQTTIKFSATPPGNGDTSAGASVDSVSVVETLTSCLAGDCNGDGTVNIQDVICTINIVLDQ